MQQTAQQTDRRLALVNGLIFAFIALTFTAMVFYAGGNEIDPAANGYSFTRNFFSSLGRTDSFGNPNPVSASLFFIALFGVGVGLLIFFFTYPRFFSGQLSCRIWSLIGSAFGIVSGLCFIGVAFTPVNLFLDAHVQFVLWAFRLIPLAIVFYTFAILQHRIYPSRYALGFAVFAVLLFAYVWLLTEGPDTDTLEGLVVQAVGQKVIVYTSLLSIFLQAHSARGLIKRGYFEPAG